MYNIPNKPEKLTFDWLFDRISQEDVYVRYFGFCELNRKYCNPLRNDSDPQCSFYWHNGVLFFNDFAFKKVYSCISVVMQSEGINYPQALDKVYNLFLGNGEAISTKKIYRPKEEKQYRDIKCKIQAFTDTDIKYLKSFGITSKLCKEYNVYSIKHYWLDGNIQYTYSEFNPCLGYYFNGKWKLYFYNAKDYRFLTNVSKTELQGFNQLDWVGDICIITKSMKDVICWRLLGYNAVAPHSEGLSDWKEKIPLLQKRFERVILNFDNDKAGERAILAVQKEFDLDSFVFKEKDLSDNIKLRGLEETQKLIGQLL